MDESEQKTGPGSEHWILIRAPGELRELRIEENRIGTSKHVPASAPQVANAIYGARPVSALNENTSGYDPNTGRWPANFALSHSDDCADTCADDCAVKMLDEQSGERRSTLTGHADPSVSHKHPATARPTNFLGQGNGKVGAVYADSGGASRFFYQAKPSTKERSAGLADGARNTHTTVKSISLMRHLVSLIAAPGATILDPFTGSGSTGIAALAEGCHFVGIEREAEYVEIARQRIAAEIAKAR
jgi:site-specific DNA-methyltransferase (adenine-specific)